MFTFIGRYFWLLCIVLAVYNFARPQPGDERSTSGFGPGVEELAILRRRILFANLVPWLVMGIGILLGGVPNIWHYFRPQDLNPYVWAWYLSGFALACVFAFWVIFRGGAENAIKVRLVQFNLFGKDVQPTQRWIKLYAAFSPLFIVLWIIFAWHLNAQVPK